MSQENVEVVREVIDAWNSHDIERWIRCWDAGGKESGVETTRPLAFVFRLRDGRIVRGESYLDVSEALDAVGLSEQDAHADS